MRLLITGNMGYLGPVLVRHLRRHRRNIEIFGYDSGFFANCLTGARTLPELQLDRQYFGDIRGISADHLEGVDGVVHLAAVSNDPMGERFKDVTLDVNYKASVRLAEIARACAVKSFVYASSCSMYGSSSGAPRREGDRLEPLTAYAQSKVATERALAALDLGAMTVTCLRFATACGMSERLRLDLVLNDFVACALAAAEITVLSDGSPWRPLIDVVDMSRAIDWAIGREATNGGAFLAVNVGRNDWNYQVKDLAASVAQAIGGTTLAINSNAPPDRRSYQVDFSLFASLAPDHVPRLALSDSIAALRQGLTDMGFSDRDFRNSSQIRLKVLEGHIAAGRLLPSLHWRNG